MSRTVEDLIHWLDQKAREAEANALRYRVSSDHWKVCMYELLMFKQASHALTIRLHNALDPGVLAIADERFRQIGELGFTIEGDAKHHKTGQLAHAAVCYAGGIKWPVWPWPDNQWKPSTDRRRNLVKAGALIAAEIDRLDNIRPKWEKHNAPQERKLAENRVREYPHGDQGRPATEAGGGYSTFEGWEEPEKEEYEGLGNDHDGASC